MALARIEDKLSEFKREHNEDFLKVYAVIMGIEKKVEKNHAEVIAKLAALDKLTLRNVYDIAYLQAANNLPMYSVRV